MARYRGPRLRIIRRLGELPGLTQKVCSRNYPAGQHGPKKKVVGNQKSKESQYAVRLKEKQKLRFNYGITERQLDNIVFRLGFAPTIAAARQLISHGHISVNAKRINIPSYLCKINDNISVNEVSRNFIKKSFDRFSALPTPSHLEVNTDNLMGKVKTLASRDNIGVQINELLVVEYYSRKV